MIPVDPAKNGSSQFAKERAMPTETLTVIVAVVVVFTVFALVLAWADHRTNR